MSCFFFNEIKPDGITSFMDFMIIYRKESKFSRHFLSEHTCKTCGKTFPNAQYKAHIKRHKKERESFLCNYPGCHKAYFDKKNLDTHVRVYHEAARFECSHEGCNAKLVSKVS